MGGYRPTYLHSSFCCLQFLHCHTACRCTVASCHGLERFFLWPVKWWLHGPAKSFLYWWQLDYAAKRSPLGSSCDIQSCGNRCEVSWSCHCVCQLAGAVNSLTKPFKVMTAPMISMEAVDWNDNSLLSWDFRSCGSDCLSPAWVELLGHVRSGYQLTLFLFYLGQLYPRVGCTGCFFVSAWHRVESSERKEPQLRKCLHEIQL